MKKDKIDETEFRISEKYTELSVNCNGIVINNTTGEIIEPRYDKDKKMVYISLTDDYTSSLHYIPLHRLVAIAFIPNPKKHPYVYRKDDDLTNNNFKNFKWGDKMKMKQKETWRKKKLEMYVDEIWTPIPRFENDYLMSDYGRIKNIKTEKHKILKISNYYELVLCKDSNKTKVNYLLLYAYLYVPNPNNYTKVRKINNGKILLNNVRWVSPEDIYI